MAMNIVNTIIEYCFKGDITPRPGDGPQSSNGALPNHLLLYNFQEIHTSKRWAVDIKDWVALRELLLTATRGIPETYKRICCATTVYFRMKDSENSNFPFATFL